MQKSSADMAAQKTFVLVHGAWHGGWCYARVAEILRAAGHRVYTPTLTGLGERAHLFSGNITLDTHVQDVVSVFEYEDLREVHLCGHSYGGFVISGAVERVPERIASLTFLDAFVPADGESLIDISLRPGPSRQLVGAMANGGLGVPPIPAANFNVNAADRDEVDRKCGPQPIGTLLQRIRLTGARERCAAKTYVRAAAYASAGFDSYRAQCAADPSWHVTDVQCGHDVMLDMPHELAALLVQSAARV